jgi:hypothetical protein
MMEEIHSIFAAGAGAVTKLVGVEIDTKTGEEKPVIERIFNPKYPYEYLQDSGISQKKEKIEAFYGR